MINNKQTINVVLVDSNDTPIGEMEKLEAHEKGLLHRAFSVLFIRKNINNNYEVLLQQRALGKYHCGGLWSNTCCSHPRIDESILQATKRRIPEELGLDSKILEQINFQSIGTFIYKADLDHNLIEHEFDHVILGFMPENPNFNDNDILNNINPNEIAEVKWVELKSSIKDVEQDPSHYTPWLEKVLNLTLEFID
tara:strand:- start:26487 stop:27071 length:585 start_codon:yes stop_codon:yes gene_type:complete